MTPYVSDSDFTLYVGDAAEVLRELPAESVHCVVTSPPYWGLRDYGTPGQLGLEPTPEAYVESMAAVFREVRRVLRRDGTCWLNLGDSYAAGADRALGRLDQDRDIPRYGSQGGGAGRKTSRSATRVDMGSLKPKDLVGIPWRVAFALQADGWYLRSDIIWSKPNPMPESVTDRPTKAHEHLFLLTREARYFYDADAIREPHSENAHHGLVMSRASSMKKASQVGSHGNGAEEIRLNPSGRNRRSVWEIATEPYPDAHFATFPQALVEPCVKAGTSDRGCCPVCGAPWVRETESEIHHTQKTWTGGKYGTEGQFQNQAANRVRDGHLQGVKHVTTLGWSCPCRHDLTPVPCTVLDPFMGSGTTALVARKHGRRSIGIELNPEYARLAADRLSQLSLLAEPA